MHEAQVALLDQIQQRQLGGLVLLGDGHHEAKVGLDEGLGRLVAVADHPAQLPLAGRGRRLLLGQLGTGFPPGLDGLSQASFVVLGEQRVLTDVVQVEADQVFLWLSGVIVGQRVLVLRDGPRKGRYMPPAKSWPGHKDGIVLG